MTDAFSREKVCFRNYSKEIEETLFLKIKFL